MTLTTGLLLLLVSATAGSLGQLQDDQAQRILLLTLIPVVVAFAFFVFVFYRSRREAAFRQKEALLQLSIVEGELKALRAQMNPHFIFNCMNSIHHYMHTNPAQAADYLIKFSQLIRHVLETSSQQTVSLADEIEANRNYIMLEQLRLNHSFEYTITTDGLDAHATYIPPMIIQPFVENSIWHGLNQRGPGGLINLYFTKKDANHIQCVIEDNGLEGSAKSEIDLSNKVKKSSLGMSLIRERFNNLNALTGSQALFEIVNREGEGKSIIVTIPFKD